MTIKIGDSRAQRLGLKASPRLTALQGEQDDILRRARLTLDKISDDLGAPELRKLEKEHDQLMARYDEIDQRISREEELEVRQAGSRMNGNDHRPIPGDVTTRGVDFGDGEYSETEPLEAFALRSNETFESHIVENRGNADELSGLATGAYLRSMILGPKTDLERRALSEGTDSAGGYTVPDILSARMIDRMRSASVVVRAGAQTVPLESDVSYVAKIVSDPVPAWRAENASVAESDPTFGRVTFTARSLAVLVKVSRELLEDSLNMESVLPNLLATALAQELDRVALLGSGTAPEPRGVANFTGLTANTYVGGDLTGYGPLIRARTALRNFNSDVTAYVLSPRDEGQLAGLTATDGQPINVPPAIARVPMLTTNKIPTNLGAGTNESIVLAGNWSRLMIGVRTAISITVLKERFADNMQYGFLAALRADVAAEQESAFTKLTKITLPS